MSEEAAKITVEAFNRLNDEHSAFVDLLGLKIESIGFGTARGLIHANPKLLRAGGTISGPAQMALADYVMYAAVLGCVGNVPLAVTTNLSINFLNKPQPGDLLCGAKVLKLGKRLVVGECSLFSEGDPRVVSHVVVTYSVPPQRD